MRSVSSYDQACVAQCGSRIDNQISAYRKLVKAAGDKASGSSEQLASAIGGFEPLFFNHMVIALDNYFCHGSRNMEGKDGNPLNEVRVLRNSLMANDGVLAADKQIRPGGSSPCGEGRSAGWETAAREGRVGGTS